MITADRRTAIARVGAPSHIARMVRGCFSCLFCLGLVGCTELRRDNTATDLPPPRVARNPTLAESFMWTNYYYPVRDHVSFSWLGRAIVGDEAWNITPDGGVADSSWYTNRDLATVNAANFGGVEPPRPPWQIVREKPSGGTLGFIGRDATGRTWNVKLDAPEYPELGSAAEAIAARLYWALGYNAPACFVTHVSGTGDARFEGRRAAAVEMIAGELRGAASLDRYRMRREVRALRVVCAWLNDTDRDDRNTLVSVGPAGTRVWLIDFNSALGSWNGRPKEPWRGRRYVWDIEWQWVQILTLGLVGPEVDPREPVVSPAVGRFSARFDPHYWRTQHPRTPFDRLTRADAAWMLAKIGRVSDELLERIVAAGQYGNPADGARVVELLKSRRERLSQFTK